VTAAAPGTGGDSPLSPDAAAQLAAEYGLQRSGVRPPLGRYLKETWAQRRFLWTLSSAQSYSRNQDNYLGQLWGVLNPLLLAAAYLLIFGELLDLDRGVKNYVGFLVIGLLVFMYSAGTMTSASKAISGNLSLVRSLRFPRAVLPLSVTLTEFIAFLPSLAVIVVLVLVTGEPLTVHWLLFPVAMLLILAINAGIALIVARVVHSSRDLRNLITLLVRLLRYVSGVFFSIATFAGHGLLGTLMQYQPFAVVLDIVRQSLLSETPFNGTSWFVALGWAVVLPTVGIIFFWRAEATYGRN
jgi:teichoic acid transport system permease protein